MKCPYCGNDDPATFLYPDDDDGPYVICLACNGEFEQGEIEYYEAQSEEGEAEEDSSLLSAAIQVLDKEIEWCNNNRGVAPGSDGDWFIKGLEQARYLILELAKIKEDDPLANQPEREEIGPLFPETSIGLDDLPENLRWLRKMRELTLKEAGEKTGLSVSFLSDMERGRVRPSLETLWKLAIAYRTPISVHLSADPTSVKDSLKGAPGYMGDYGGIPHGPFDI